MGFLDDLEKLGGEISRAVKDSTGDSVETASGSHLMVRFSCPCGQDFAFDLVKVSPEALANSLKAHLDTCDEAQKTAGK